MKNTAIALIMFFAFSSIAQANVLSGEKGEIDTQLKHVGSTDWNTGLGRHDAIVRWASGENYYLKTVRNSCYQESKKRS